MPLNTVKPMKTQHTAINMFRPPYRKKLPASYKMQDTKNDFQRDIDILFDTFLMPYNEYKAGKMTKKMDECYKIAGIPCSPQYKAFSEFFNFFKEEELSFLGKEDFYFYDMTKIDNNSKLGLIEFIENLTKFDFKGKRTKLIYASGSFWGKNLDIRAKIISYLKILHDKGFELEVYMNANETEEHMQDLVPLVKEKHFGLTDRIPIHFILCGNYLFFEFPHTENIIVRLNMFMDLNAVALKPNRSKTDIVLFLNNLIKKVLDNNE